MRRRAWGVCTTCMTSGRKADLKRARVSTDRRRIILVQRAACRQRPGAFVSLGSLIMCSSMPHRLSDFLLLFPLILLFAIITFTPHLVATISQAHLPDAFGRPGLPLWTGRRRTGSGEVILLMRRTKCLSTTISSVSGSWCCTPRESGGRGGGGLGQELPKETVAAAVDRE